MLSLCLHLSFLFLYLLIAVVFVINYGLECFTNLGLAYIHHSAHILFVYKLVLVISNLGGLNVHWCFTHYLNFNFQTHAVIVTIDQPIKNFMSRPDAARHMVQGRSSSVNLVLSTSQRQQSKPKLW